MICIDKVVPFSAFSLLDVSFTQPITAHSDKEDPREITIIEEQTLIEMLLEHLKNYSPGKVLHKSLTLQI